MFEGDTNLAETEIAECSTRTAGKTALQRKASQPQFTYVRTYTGHSAAMRLFLTLVPLIFSPPLQAKKNSFDGDCPPKCNCSTIDVTCLNIGHSGSDIFLPIRPESFPDLVGITVSGGQIGDISHQNLFGMQVVHKNLDLLNISYSGTTGFDNETFQGLPKLKYFYLNDNSIETVGEDPFRWNLQLTRLDLSRAFSRKANVVEKQKLIRNLFMVTNNHFLHLTDLLLNENDLTELLPQTFCKMEALVKLYLSGNKLTEFSIHENCLGSLHVLDLSNNQIISPSPQIFNTLQSLQALDVSGNPLHCDCQINAFVKLTFEKVLNQGRTICVSPSSVEGANALERTDFTCPSGHNILIPLMLLVCLVVLFIIGFRVYRSRVKLENLPFVAGYTKLGANEAVAPQFV